jgi:hypothetical protein
MGHGITQLCHIRAANIGADVGEAIAEDHQNIDYIVAELKLRPEPRPRDMAVLARYIRDMQYAVHEVARVLKPGGKAVYVVGENTVRGTYIPNSAIVSIVAGSFGLELESRRVRTLPANRRYLPPPSLSSDLAPLDTRMRTEVILVFARPLPKARLKQTKQSRHRENVGGQGG